MSTDSSSPKTLFGHPTGLYILFFTEMWERFSYYGMRALLMYYMIKGFLHYNDTQAYALYGAYAALVYTTPFIGGILADRILGAKRAVVIGGILMGIGQLLLTVQHEKVFFIALSFLIIGNGFFKPNISTMVGSLYPEGSQTRDSGFTIFYMGINLGAALAPLICGYIGETYGWHYGFGLASLGMSIGLAVFILPDAITKLVILFGSFFTAAVMIYFQIQEGNMIMLAVNGLVGLALLAAGIIAFMAISIEGLPKNIGAPKVNTLQNGKDGTSIQSLIYIGIIIAIPLISFLLSKPQIAEILLSIFGVAAFGYLAFVTMKSTKIERERMYVVFVMMFFSMLFWAFFEQAGTSINNFTDRNVKRVNGIEKLSESDVGKSKTIELSQAHLGYRINGKIFTISQLDDLKKKKNELDQKNKDGNAVGESPFKTTITVDQSHIGMELGGTEINASVFQSTNPIFILIFGLAFSALWGFLASKKLDPSTPVKFVLALVQLGLGFMALVIGAKYADQQGMVSMSWLLLAYLLHTTGELCLSPVGLSMVTKLSPAKLISTVMGAWFLATAFSNVLAARIAISGVSHGKESKIATIPPPIDTLNSYVEVFDIIAKFSFGSALILLIMSPLLNRWMHEDKA